MRLAALILLALPQGGVVVPGESLGGVRLGATPVAVTAAWGPRHGVCGNCRQRTWYFNYVRFQPQGLGVEFRGGRVAALFTLWSPSGWRTREGLRTGDPERRVAALYRRLERRSCGRYDVLVLARRATRTHVYIYEGKVWGFGVSRAVVPPCR